MNLSRDDWRKLALPGVVCVALLAVGGTLIWGATQSQRSARVTLAAAQKDRAEKAERLARIAEEEREVREKLQVYEQLQRLNILGEERRLEWADAINRIRAERELLDLKYKVDRQRLLMSLPGKPGSVDFFASPMQVQIALLHEGDLVRFLSDLRASGNAYYSVKHCDISRTGQAATGAGLTPRLRADCDIDLITIQDRGAKK